jgi:molecular chaperone GrpE (heat shock protein)
LPKPAFAVLDSLFTVLCPLFFNQDNSITPEMQATWRACMHLVRWRLLDILATTGVQPMHTHGQPFDPHRHVALEVIAASEQRPVGIIVAELRRGYMASNRVLRPAEVVISSASDEPPQLEQNGGTHSS